MFKVRDAGSRRWGLELVFQLLELEISRRIISPSPLKDVCCSRTHLSIKDEMSAATGGQLPPGGGPSFPICAPLCICASRCSRAGVHGEGRARVPEFYLLLPRAALRRPLPLPYTEPAGEPEPAQE
ncbi:hypothetical protein EVAR_329_1 [Eumeta japonica]|uniref:Uncharacterized protein n=1 Tax=Eumeta variegata TaxID=151549 RepID=A0A4C1S9V2_EUMVA|nr:hypothetical protein EVAR_329_1 [Eumeta japonica]